MRDKIQLAIAWTFLVGGLAGFVLSALRLIAKQEPLLVLLLSWGALIYEGFNSIMIARGNKSEPCKKCGAES